MDNGGWTTKMLQNDGLWGNVVRTTKAWENDGLQSKTWETLCAMPKTGKKGDRTAGT